MRATNDYANVPCNVNSNSAGPKQFDTSRGSPPRVPPHTAHRTAARRRHGTHALRTARGVSGVPGPAAARARRADL